MLVVLIWIGICIAAYFITTEMQFYIVAVTVGLVMGGIQSLSRSTYGKIMPETHDTASFFSFYDVTEKIAIVIGMFSFGFVQQLTGNMRNSVIALIVFFIAGCIGLFLTLQKAKTIALLNIADETIYNYMPDYFKLDGGAMFGVVPKSIWNKLNPADENNMCTWALRCLLIEIADKKNT